MKKTLFLFIAGMCLLLGSCGNREKPTVSASENLSVNASEKLSVSTPEKVYVTFYSGSDVHYWELSPEEIDDWVAWMNDLTVSPLDLEEGKRLLDHVYRSGSNTGYSFDAGPADYLERIEYIDCGSEHVYLRMDNDWYRIANPTEPFKKY